MTAPADFSILLKLICDKESPQIFFLSASKYKGELKWLQYTDAKWEDTGFVFKFKTLTFFTVLEGTLSQRRLKSTGLDPCILYAVLKVIFNGPLQSIQFAKHYIFKIATHFLYTTKQGQGYLFSNK